MRFFLGYCILVFIYTGCKEHPSQAIEQNSPLFPEPFVVPLNTSGGYAVNKLTGDSIKSLINSFGDTIKTGIPFSIKGTSYNSATYFKTKIISAAPLTSRVVETNTYPVKGKPAIIPAQSGFENKVPLNRSIKTDVIGPNEKLITGKPIPAVGKTIPLHEPKPVKILPMRFKDNATHDIQYLDVAQGLNYSYVIDVMEDKKGYIWFGTDGYGLCKYDGVYLTTYTDKNGLAGNQVSSIVEDKQGNIWIGTNGGISVFDGKKFTQYTEKEGLQQNHVDKIIEDNKGNFWIATEGIGIACFDGKNFTTYSEKEGLPDNSAGEFFYDSKGFLWCATNGGVAKFDGNRFQHFNNQLRILDAIYSIVEDSKGNIWFGSIYYGLIKYDGKNFTHYTKENGLTDNSIISMSVDKNDNIWIATRYGGVCKFDGFYFTTYGLDQGLSDNKVSNIKNDSQGNIWICTNGGGICKLNEAGFSEKIKPGYLGNSRVRPILQDISGNLWFGTEGAGLYKYDGTVIEKIIGDNQFALRGFRSVMTDKKNNLWFGESDGSGLYKYDHKQFLYYSPPSRVSNNLSIYEDNNNNIWIGTNAGGVTRFNGNEVIYYSTKEGFSSNRIFIIMQDKKNNLWFGTEGGGLVKYDGKYFTVFSERQGLFAKSITSIIEDAAGNLWLGTFQAGLCKFDGTHFTYYTEEQGLSFNDIWSIQEDSNKYIWVGTDKGLSVLIPRQDSLNKDKTDYSIYSFGQQDGIRTADFNLKSVCIDNDNHIWWGTGKALITRDLKTPFKPSSPRSLSINYIEINDQFYDFRNRDSSINDKFSFSSIAPFHNYPDELSLPHDQNHLNFYFSAIDWQAPHKIKYSYRLLGSDNNWSNPSTETQVEFRNLSHGSYDFQVKAIGQSQEWTAPISYRFIIRPPWWLTWWFKSIVVLVLLSVIFLIVRFIYRYQLRKQRVAMEKQLAVQMERQRISSEMHDDIGAGLSGVRLLTEMTKNKLKDTDATGEMDKIYESVGDISAKMKEVIWSLNTENDNLGNLAFFIQKQVRSQLEHYHGEISFDIPATFPDIQINGEVRRNIYLAVKEAVHNIIKHSGADKIKLSVTADDALVITVSDNGKGLDIEKNKSTGNGMRNMQMRMKNINGMLIIKNGEGTILTFTIPLKTSL